MSAGSIAGTPARTRGSAGGVQQPTRLPLTPSSIPTQFPKLLSDSIPKTAVCSSRLHKVVEHQHYREHLQELMEAAEPHFVGAGLNTRTGEGWGLCSMAARSPALGQ